MKKYFLVAFMLLGASYAKAQTNAPSTTKATPFTNVTGPDADALKKRYSTKPATSQSNRNEVNSRQVERNPAVNESKAKTPQPAYTAPEPSQYQPRQEELLTVGSVLISK